MITSKRFNESALGQQVAGFTLTEIMVVVVIFALIAGFGTAGYGKAVRKSRERAAVLSLTSLHAANEIYTAKYGEYLQKAGINEVGLAIPHDQGLEIDIKPVDMTYSYTSVVATTYWAEALWPGSGTFTVCVDERPITLPDNPCCSGGTCPTLPACPGPGSCP